LLSSRLTSDQGSAVTEFVLAVIPITILILPLIDLFGLFQVVIVKEQEAFEIARYASLADVTDQEAESFRIFREPTSTLARTTGPTDCLVQVTIPVSRSIVLWPYPVGLNAVGSVHCEVS